MSATRAEELVDVSKYTAGAEKVSRTIQGAVERGGKPVEAVADALHGEWLGHPLHPALTDFVVGAWTMGSILNLLPGNRASRKAARSLIGIGIFGAIPTALSGVTDFSTIRRTQAAGTGATHGLLNTAALGCYIASFASGGNGSRGASRTYSTLGLGIAMVSAWLGGELVYKHGIGVNETEGEAWAREQAPGQGSGQLSMQGAGQESGQEFAGRE